MAFTDYTSSLKILGLEHKSTLTVVEVKKAYRKLIIKHHPDKFKSEENKARATENFKKITKAYEYVLDNLEIYKNFNHQSDEEEQERQWEQERAEQERQWEQERQRKEQQRKERERQKQNSYSYSYQNKSSSSTNNFKNTYDSTNYNNSHNQSTNNSEPEELPKGCGLCLYLILLFIISCIIAGFITSPSSTNKDAVKIEHSYKKQQQEKYYQQNNVNSYKDNNENNVQETSHQHNDYNDYNHDNNYSAPQEVIPPAKSENVKIKQETKKEQTKTQTKQAVQQSSKPTLSKEKEIKDNYEYLFE